MNIFNSNGFLSQNVRLMGANLGQVGGPLGPYGPLGPFRRRPKKEEEEEIVIIVPKKPPPPPPPTPPLSFMMPLRRGPEPPEPPPPPPGPLPPLGPPVATPGSLEQEFASCKRCPDGSFKTMNALDAAAAGCVYTDPVNCLPPVPSVDVRVPLGPPVASVDRYMPYQRLRETPPAPTPVPVATPATTSQPLSYQDVATEGAGFPTATGFAPESPRYTDVATPSTPQYSSDLQRQIDSYQQRLQEFSERPMTPSIYEQTLTPQEVQAEALRRHEEWLRSSGMQPSVATPATTSMQPQTTSEADRYNLTPQNMRPDVATGQCPPDAQGRPQFWDGRQCRGSIAPGASGLISQAMNLAPAATIAPSEFAMPSMPATSFMGGMRFPVVNL